NLTATWQRLRSRDTPPAPGADPRRRRMLGVIDRPGVAEFYRQALFLPDRFRSWIRPAVRLGRSWRFWQPHLIYSSGPPNSGHIVASLLAKRLMIPWVAEFRDL